MINRCCLFVLSIFPRDVLDEILNLIESVSWGVCVCVGGGGFLPTLAAFSQRGGDSVTFAELNELDTQKSYYKNI